MNEPIEVKIYFPKTTHAGTLHYKVNPGQKVTKGHSLFLEGACPKRIHIKSNKGLVCITGYDACGSRTIYIRYPQADYLKKYVYEADGFTVSGIDFSYSNNCKF